MISSIYDGQVAVRAGHHLSRRSAVASVPEKELSELIASVIGKVAPLWPLQDFVAVNPFLGWADHSFLNARHQLLKIQDGELLMPADYYRSLIDQGRVTVDDLSAAVQQCARQEPDWYPGWTAAGILHALQHSTDPGAGAERELFTVAEQLDRQVDSHWNSTVITEISRCCAAHFDQGQAAWGSPWRHLSLYRAWRQIAAIDGRMPAYGLTKFPELVERLPEDPRAAIGQLLEILHVPPAWWQDFLLCELYSVIGWASFIQYRLRGNSDGGESQDDLIGLLAIRLAYDAALAQHATQLARPTAPPRWESFDAEGPAADAVPARSARVRYVAQVAAEIAYRRQLLDQLTGYRSQETGPSAGKSTRKLAQMVFCIDVRSELMRRHLESVSSEIETFGFAGFFGLPMEHVPLGATHGSDQCPVLLTPSFQVHDHLRGADESVQYSSRQRRAEVRLWRKLWKSFQQSSTTCFSFVESTGLFYAWHLVRSALGRPAGDLTGRFDGVPRKLRSRLAPGADSQSGCQLTRQQKVDMAAGMLRNLGLTKEFARLVVLCGHACDTTNNPYRAGLDCGACGGHSGESNARLAAALLNDPSVRHGLNAHGITLTDDVWFLAAVHHTTTDEIEFFDVDQLPASHRADWKELRSWTVESSGLVRAERAGRLGGEKERVERRARDWSEVRPEWGLAGNAAFIVAPRSRTAGLNLQGRTFMHSYDYSADSDRRVLELILTAPMVVASWINLQYYASTVDNRRFGSGNKVLHNIVGQLGVLEGNGGDLRTGLPWQSVHDGRQLQHQPLRLLVVVEAPRDWIAEILDRHPSVRQLLTGQWIQLVSLEGSATHRYTHHGTWEPV